jgi:hypothetical protein
MDAGRLLERCAKQDEASAAAEMGAWRAAHGPTAFAELAWFARSTSDPGLRMLALAALDAEDPAAVEVSVACARTRAPAPMRRCGWLASAPAHVSAARGGCHHPAASSSLMRLRLRLWVERTDAR